MPPAFLRPLLRLYFNRILKKGVFPKGWKAHKALNPATGPATPAQARVRLEGVLARFDQEYRRRAASSTPREQRFRYGVARRPREV
ncbi:MAG TPA: hypothetical protein VLG74_08040 [Blastocatellia bacterium]|nr:hypothetical protein [Blastocatellia bacterium]